MNQQVLKKYNIKFQKNHRAHWVEGTDNLGIYMSRFNIADMIEGLINDIDLAISKQYDKIENPNWYVELGLDIYCGFINDNMTFSICIYKQHDPVNSIDYPLEDIKELFISWLKFISQEAF